MKESNPTVLPNEKTTLRNLDRFVGMLLSRVFTYDKNFYVPNSTNKKAICSMFAINEEASLQETKNLVKNVLSIKENIGTQKALKQSLKQVLGDVKIKQEESFSFSVLLDSNLNLDSNLKTAYSIIEEIKPLRDRMVSLDLSLKNQESPIELQIITKMKLILKEEKLTEKSI